MADPAAAPAAGGGHDDHGHGHEKPPWWKNGFIKAGVIFAVIIAAGYGLGTIAQPVNDFIRYVMDAFLQTVANHKTTIFVLLAAVAMAKWIMS